MAETSVEASDQAFLQDNAANLVRVNQVVACMMPFAFLSVLPADFFMNHLIVPLRTLLLVRACIVLYHVVLAGLAFTSATKRSPNAFAALLFLSCSASIIALTAITGGALSPYDQAIMADIFLMSTVVPWRVRHFAPTALLCVVLYPVALMLSETLGETAIWVAHTTIFFAVTLVGSGTTFLMERMRRAAFTNRQLLERALATIQEQQHNVNADLNQARNFQKKLLRPLPGDESIEFVSLYTPPIF